MYRNEGVFSKPPVSGSITIPVQSRNRNQIRMVESQRQVVRQVIARNASEERKRVGKVESSCHARTPCSQASKQASKQASR